MNTAHKPGENRLTRLIIFRPYQTEAILGHGIIYDLAASVAIARNPQEVNGYMGTMKAECREIPNIRGIIKLGI